MKPLKKSSPPFFGQTLLDEKSTPPFFDGSSADSQLETSLNFSFLVAMRRHLPPPIPPQGGTALLGLILGLAPGSHPCSPPPLRGDFALAAKKRFGNVAPTGFPPGGFAASRWIDFSTPGGVKVGQNRPQKVDPRFLRIDGD